MENETKLPPDDMPLAQAANWYANRALEDFPAGEYRHAMRGALMEAYIAGTKRTIQSKSEIDRLRTDCAEAYQVVGTLAEAAGVFDSAEVQRVLDNLDAAATPNAPKPHASVLPFIVPKRSKGSEHWTCPKGHELPVFPPEKFCKACDVWSFGSEESRTLQAEGRVHRYESDDAMFADLEAHRMTAQAEGCLRDRLERTAQHYETLPEAPRREALIALLREAAEALK